jgi:hypothetical protein
MVLHLLAMVVVWPLTQRILNNTVVTLPYTVMYPCDTPFAELSNAASIHIPGPFGATLDAYKTTLSTDAVDPAGRPIKTSLGYATFPKMTLKRGDNALDFTVGVVLSDASTVITDFILPMFSENKTVQLFLDAENVTAHVLHFFPVPDLHLHKVLRCTGTKTTDPKEIPAKYCQPTKATTWASPGMNELIQTALGRRLQGTVGDTQKGYVIKCTADKGGLDVASVVV